eukprot:5183799-Amphidinium_carterae.2
MLSKIASMSFSSHISQSGEYQHQTSSVKQWINSFRNLRIRRPKTITASEVSNMMEGGTPAAFNQPTQPSQLQQVISTSSLKELQRASSFTASPKWSEGYIWTSIKDAGDWVNGEIRPTRSITGTRFNEDGTKITTASALWHVHHDAVFSLTASYYHLSMQPSYGDHQPTSEEEAAAEGAASTEQPAAPQQTAGQQPSATAGQPASSAETSTAASTSAPDGALVPH